MLRLAPILRWRIAILCGLLWGVALAGLELSVEFGEWPGLSSFADAAIGLAAIWGLTGIGWATLTCLAEPAAGTLACVALWLAGSVLFTAIQVGAITSDPFARFFGDIGDFPADAIAVHVLWLNAFYGGIYTVGYLAFGRSVRSRRRVGRLQRVLDEEAARASESALRSARAQLQPDILVEALAAARASYRRRPAAADMIVQQLILFLRAASGNDAERAATLGNELTLAAAYLRLQAALRGRLDDWTVDLAIPAPALPFPPRVLVPMIARLGRDAALLALTSGYRADGFFVQLSATGHLPTATRHRRPADALDLPDPAARPWTFASATIDNARHWTATAATISAPSPIARPFLHSATEGITL